MKFIDVSPEDFPMFREGRRGRVSYPILKSFLETGKTLVMLDRTGMQQSLQTLTSCLGGYIRNHGLPIKMMTRANQIYLMRTDIDERTKKPFTKKTVEEFEKDAREGRSAASGQPRAVTPATPINAAEVSKRFAAEKGQVTK